MSDFYQQDTQTQAARLQQAAADALQHWGLTGATLDLIKHRENAVFSVRQGEQRAALRLHRHGYHSDAALRSELQWMQALANSGIAVPEVIPAKSGEPFIHYSAPGLPGELQVDLFEWIDGEQLGSVEEGIADATTATAVYTSLGELAACVHNQASNWQIPDGFTRHAWDAEGLAGEQPFWGQFWKLQAASAAQSELLRRGRDAVYQGLRALPRSADIYSMIHADFVAENVMLHNGQARLIDFDDAGFGWHVFELATSLYFIQSESCYEQAKQALIDGYRAHRALSDEQLDTLPLLMLARGFTYLGWVHTRQETETAEELTPMLLEMACTLAENYLQNNRGG